MATTDQIYQFFVDGIAHKLQMGPASICSKEQEAWGAALWFERDPKKQDGHPDCVKHL